MEEVRGGENYRRDAEGAEKGERINTDCTEKNGEHREGGRTQPGVAVPQAQRRATARRRRAVGGAASKPLPFA